MPKKSKKDEPIPYRIPAELPAFDEMQAAAMALHQATGCTVYISRPDSVYINIQADFKRQAIKDVAPMVISAICDLMLKVIK